MNQNLPNLAAVLQFLNGSEIASTHNHLTIQKYSKLHRQRLWIANNNLIESTTNSKYLPNGLLNPSHQMTNDSLSKRPRRHDMESTRILVVGYQSRSCNGLGQQSRSRHLKRARCVPVTLLAYSLVRAGLTFQSAKCDIFHGEETIFLGRGDWKTWFFFKWERFLNGTKWYLIVFFRNDNIQGSLNVECLP